MSRTKKWAVAGFSAFLLITGLIIFLSGPLIKPLLELAIRSQGFPHAHIENVHILPSGLLLENISLDGDSFSTIEAAQITATIPELLFNKKIRTIDFKNIELTGEIDENGQYIIAGWNASLQSSDTPEQTGIIIENIAMNGLTLDFETPEGAIRIEGKLALQTAPDKTRDFQANLWGKQKQLSLNATAIGKIAPSGQWTADIELLEGRLDMDAVKVSRASGNVTLKSVVNGISYQGRMIAGGLRVYDTPFQDLDISFDATKPEILNFTTSPTGHEGIALKGLLLNKSPLALQLGIEIKDVNDVGSLLEIKKEDLIWLSSLHPLVFSLTAPLNEIASPHIMAQWKLLAGSSGETLSGTAQYQKETQLLTGSLTPTEIKAGNIGALLPVKQKNDIKLTEGLVRLDGTFSSSLAASPLKITGAATLQIKNIGGTWQDYPFNQVSGVIKLGQIYPWSIEKNQSLRVGTIGTGVNLTNGSVIFDGNAEKGISVKTMNFAMADGILSTKPFLWKTTAKENSITVVLDNISLNALASSAVASGFSADGRLSGTLPLAVTSSGLVFRNGTISSVGAGSFKYAPSVFPPALQGDDVRMTTVRHALSDFNFSSLEIGIDGDLENNLKTTLKASGKNPVFSDRVINLNINLEGALVPALQQALQPGRIADRIEKSVTGE